MVTECILYDVAMVPVMYILSCCYGYRMYIFIIFLWLQNACQVIKERLEPYMTDKPKADWKDWVS